MRWNSINYNFKLLSLEWMDNFNVFIFIDVCNASLPSSRTHSIRLAFIGTQKPQAIIFAFINWSIIWSISLQWTNKYETKAKTDQITTKPPKWLFIVLQNGSSKCKCNECAMVNGAGWGRGARRIKICHKYILLAINR